MNPGQGNANFLADLANNESDETMRQRWKDGHYGKPRPDYIMAWRAQAGRTTQESE